MSYYKIIDGIRYERMLLEKAETFQQVHPTNQIDLEAMQQLYAHAKDSRRVTETEQRTLYYIYDYFDTHPEAKAWLDAQDFAFSTWDIQTKRVLYDRYDLYNIKWEFPEDEMIRQEALRGKDSPINFELALSHAIHSFIYDPGRGELGIRELVDYRFLDLEGPQWITEAVRSFVNRGTLYLIPLDRSTWTEFEFELPFIDLVEGIESSYWLFGLHIPEIPLFRFLAFVHRQQAECYTQTYFTKSLPTEKRVHFVLSQMLGLDRVSWTINGEAANTQEKNYPTNQQSWEQSLYVALDRGLYNRESSLSFWDHLTEEIWPDPEKSISAYIREYLANGCKVHLLSNHDLAKAFFPLPESIHLSFEDFWYFGLVFPRQTNIQVLISKSRKGQGIGDSWNDAFILDDMPFENRVTQILQEDFKLEGLRWEINPAEVQFQHDTYDPWWRNTSSVIRQAIHTYLHDYLSDQSLFYWVSQIHGDEFHPDNFSSDREYRQAVSNQIHRYLKTGSLFLIPSKVYQMTEKELGAISPPPYKEKLEDYWIFQLMLPEMGDVAFYACVPRWPSFEEVGRRPYNYGV